MRVYNQPHRYYCGVDLHARSLFGHVLDAKAPVFRLKASEHPAQGKAQPPPWEDVNHLTAV